MSPSDEIGLVWFRSDLRLDDNPAWAAATSERKAVVPLYILDQRRLDRVGPYRRRQLIANLQALDYDLFEATGGRLLVRYGDPVSLVPEAVDVLHAGAVYLNADVSPFSVRRDELVCKQLGVPVFSWYGSLVHAPGRVLTKSGTFAKTFGGFYKSWQAAEWEQWPEPGDAIIYDDPGEALPILDGPPPFFEGVGEAGRRLSAFVAHSDRYEVGRNRVDLGLSSKLSVDLRFGTISARTVAKAVGDETPGARLFNRQLALRDWYAHLLYENPSMARDSLNTKFDNVEWRDAPAEISAWKGGFTGYPIVDAGMRQLRETGWMHHRVRVVCASFLVKDLLVDWRLGEKHFRHFLADGELAQSVGNWQSIAGVGIDALPFHRVLDPVKESRELDPEGAYLRRWLPELEALSNEAIHAPWEADLEAVAGAGVTLGSDYPDTVVDHDVAKDRFIAAYKASLAFGE